MTRRSLARSSALIFATLLGSPLLLLGCPKKQPPAEAQDSAPPPAPVDSGPTVLTPLDDDSGPDAAEAAAPRPAYHPVNNNTAAIKQCCGALRVQAKALGASPEANVLLSLAVQCDQFAVAATTGNAPEFAAIRQMLSRGTMPPACQGIK